MATTDHTDPVTRTRELFDRGDIAGGMRSIRLDAGHFTIPDLAALVRTGAEAAGFDDLVRACDALAGDHGDPAALYDFGYACVEHGAAYAAIPVLVDAVRRAPDVPALRAELVSALDAEERHAEAVDVLRGRETSWFEHYLTAYHQTMAGRLDDATATFRALPAPDEERFAWAYGRLARMHARADAARTATALDTHDLRGWHFVLTGGYLTTLSPYGFDQGMTGRYAYVQDDYDMCLFGLLRLGRVLAAAGREPRAVAAVPGDRSSAILAEAAGEVLDLRVAAYDADPERAAHTLLVAYDLGEADVETVAPLRRRAPGQVLYEHARCWTSPPAAAADVCTSLHQVNVSPWGRRLGPDGPQEPDARPGSALAGLITGAPRVPDVTQDASAPEGAVDGVAPPALLALVAATSGLWLDGARDEAGSTGPVRSSRFA